MSFKTRPRGRVFLKKLRHCEERSDEAIQLVFLRVDCFASLAMTSHRPALIARSTSALGQQSTFSPARF